jgi:hypothetical protein
MKTFLYDATLLEPTELAPDVQEGFPRQSPPLAQKTYG